jgi:hypothetical protein
MTERLSTTSTQRPVQTWLVVALLLVAGGLGWRAWEVRTASAGEPQLKALGEPVTLAWAELPADELTKGLFWTSTLPALSAVPIPGVDEADGQPVRPRFVGAPFTREAPQELLAVSIPDRLGLQRISWKIRAFTSLSNDGSNYLTTFTSSGDCYPRHRLRFSPNFDSGSRVLRLRIGYQFPDGKTYVSRLDFVLGKKGFELVTW